MDKIDFLKKIFNFKLPNNKYALIIICFFTGVLGAIPYYCEKLFVLTFASLFIQFYIIISQRRAGKCVFLPFFVYFFGFYFSIYLFLSELYPYERFGFTESQGVFVVICSCLLIPLLHAAVESLVMLISKLFPDNLLCPLGFASLWVLGEALLTVGTMAFPWANTAVSLTGWLPYLQTASLFGKGFISFVTVFSCCALAIAIKNKQRLFALLGIGVLTLNIVAGYVLWLMPIKHSEEFKSAVIQGNVLSNEKWSYSNRDEIFNRYISMTEEAAKNGAKLILLPESAIPTTFVENGRIHKSIAEITSKYETTVILGVNYYENSQQFNSVVAILPDGSISGRYDKRHLVPFGEFIPFANSLGKIFPFVGELSSDSGAYYQGEESKVFSTEVGNVSALVCFDSIFSSFSREACNDGSEIITVVTNDSWFNDSAGVYTHLRHSQIRAIENRRYVVRAANTGVSAFIDERGQILESTLPLESDIGIYNAYTINSITLYTIVGDIGIYLSALLVLVIILNHIRRTFKWKRFSFTNLKSTTEL